MTTPLWLAIQNACEIARSVGILRPYSVRLTTANAEALIEELKSVGKGPEIIWRVGGRLLSMRANGVEVVVDDDAIMPEPVDRLSALKRAIYDYREAYLSSGGGSIPAHDEMVMARQRLFGQIEGEKF